MVWKGDSQNRLAKSLVTLIDEVVEELPQPQYPQRRHDRRHASSSAQVSVTTIRTFHWAGKGIVTALDITHDPAHGFDALAFAESLRLQQEALGSSTSSSTGRIFGSKEHPWEWRNRKKGPGDHSEHVHISVVDDLKLYDDASPWNLTMSGGAGRQGHGVSAQAQARRQRAGRPRPAKLARHCGQRRVRRRHRRGRARVPGEEQLVR